MSKNEKIKSEVALFCKRYSRNDELMDYIIEQCQNRVAIGSILNLFNTGSYSQLTYIDTYFIIKSIKNYNDNKNDEVQDKNKIKLTDYLHYFNFEKEFTIAEIQDAESFYFEADEKIDTIVIPNVIRVDNLFTSVKLPFSIIAKMFNNGIVNYNYQAQREATVVDTKLGEHLLKPTVYRDHVEDIKFHMQQGTFFTNHVVFNILNNGEELFEYNEKNKTLKFTKTAMSQMNILDGYHRCSAITELINSGEYTEDSYIQANIFNLNIEEAQSYINQEAKASPISEIKRESLKKTIENDIINNINTKGSIDTNRMFKKISSNIDEVKKFYIKYALQNMLSSTLEDNFDKEELKKRKCKVQITKDLLSIFDFWVEIHQDEFDNLEKNIKAKNYKVTSAMFASLIYIYSKYYKLEKNEEMIDDLETIDEQFKLSESEMKNMFRSNLPKPARKKIYELIDSKITIK